MPNSPDRTQAITETVTRYIATVTDGSADDLAAFYADDATLEQHQIELVNYLFERARGGENQRPALPTWLIGALGRVKSYLDYGAFTPIQVAATAALNGPQDCIAEIRERYRARRDVLLDGLHQAGWDVPAPAGTMFAWAPIPEEFRGLGSLAFSKLLLERANVAVAPGGGFGEYGEGFVRIALVENRQRLRQASRNIKAFLSGRNDTAELRRAAARTAAAAAN